MNKVGSTSDIDDALTVTSEIYAETDFKCQDINDLKSVSTFTFHYPNDSGNNPCETDTDGDLIVRRRKKGEITIEHHKRTDLSLVGLQVWRGALLLADYIFHNRNEFKEKRVLELGSGVGLTGIAAAIYSKDVVCTDIDVGGILNVIADNVKRNNSLIRNNVQIVELDFKAQKFSDRLESIISDIDIVICADVIYDDDLTDSFVETLTKLLEPKPNRSPPVHSPIYIALEKRYVFTVDDLESLAPCYEHFLSCIDKIRWSKRWKFESIPIDFPQYFEYERVKELVLLKLSVM
ncbi:Methyltransferase-like protein 22, partial [Pseudolycoriella hygida]